MKLPLGIIELELEWDSKCIHELCLGYVFGALKIGTIKF